MQRFLPLFALALFAAALFAGPVVLAADSNDVCTQEPAHTPPPRRPAAVAAVRG